MNTKRICQSVVAVAMVAASFASAGGVLAASSCTSYITVQSGDTLSGIASACGTTVAAIQAANPGIGTMAYAGQVLYIPTGYASSAVYYPAQMGGSTYVAQWGDTLGTIAARNGLSLADILAANPQIWNASLIFPGQVINLPGRPSVQPSAYYANTYYPNSYAPNTYYPNTSYPSAAYVSPAATHQFSVLKVTSRRGLLVRTGPGMNYSLVHSSSVSAVNRSTWWYRKGSATMDPIGFVWVEIQLSPNLNGDTGWIMVKDSLGNYFTDPNIDH